MRRKNAWLKFIQAFFYGYFWVSQKLHNFLMCMEKIQQGLKFNLVNYYYQYNYLKLLYNII
jgi:hypothetical protein